MFYDVTKDPTAIEIIKKIPNRKITKEEILEAFHAAEPERQLCIISLLEMSSGQSMTELKRDAVNQLLAKVGSPLQV